MLSSFQHKWAFNEMLPLSGGGTGIEGTCAFKCAPDRSGCSSLPALCERRPLIPSKVRRNCGEPHPLKQAGESEWRVQINLRVRIDFLPCACFSVWKLYLEDLTHRLDVMTTPLKQRRTRARTHVYTRCKATSHCANSDFMLANGTITHYGNLWMLLHLRVLEGTI